MFGISVKADTDRMAKALSAVATKQLPWATAAALNDTAQAVHQDTRRLMESVFDRPTPFTLGAFRVEYATKDKLSAAVLTKDIQGRYLPLQESGGVEMPTGSVLLNPVGVRLNQYGNLPRNALKTLLARPDVFVARKRSSKTSYLAPGIYQRTDFKAKNGRRVGTAAVAVATANGARTSRLKLLIAFKPSQTVQGVLPFHRNAAEVASKVFGQRFAYRFAQALATAR